MISSSVTDPSAQVWRLPPGDGSVLCHEGRLDGRAQHCGRDGLVPEHDPDTFPCLVILTIITLSSPVLLRLSNSHWAGDHLWVGDGGEDGGGMEGGAREAGA